MPTYNFDRIDSLYQLRSGIFMNLPRTIFLCNKNGANNSDGLVTTNTMSATVGDFPNRILVAFISADRTSSFTVSTVTYGGVSMTKLAGASSSGGYLKSEIWYLINPTIGTANIVATGSTTAFWTMTSGVFSGVHQTVPFGTTVSSATTGEGSSVDIVCDPDDLIIDSLSIRQNYVCIPTNQDLIATTYNTSGYPRNSSSCKRAVSTSGTVAWSWTGSILTTHLATNLKPVW
jgi:hypothetical protein